MAMTEAEEERLMKWPMVAGWRAGKLTGALSGAKMARDTVERLFADEDMKIPDWRKKSIRDDMEALLTLLELAVAQTPDEIWKISLELDRKREGQK